MQNEIAVVFKYLSMLIGGGMPWGQYYVRGVVFSLPS